MGKKRQSPHTALVLTGGGARAAYQVGVLKAISEWLPRLATSPFSIYCGTSAGAINATALACDSSYFRLGIKKLEWLWSNLHTKNIFHSQFHSMFGYLARQGFARLQASYHNTQPFGLLDNRPLRTLLNRTLKYNKIDTQIKRNILRGLAITASNYQNSHSVTFYQGQIDIAPWKKSRAMGMPSLISTEHLLASSAIPFVFPASQIGHSYYGDGSVHQVLPLLPALNLGASKILIIDLTPKIRKSKETKTQVPGLASLGGHLMDAIFADTLSADIDHLLHLNQIAKTIDSKQRIELGLKQVDILQLAAPTTYEPMVKQHYHQMPLAARTLMRLLGINPEEDSSITSYLLFETDYIQDLIATGYQKAQEKEKEIRFLLNY